MSRLQSTGQPAFVALENNVRRALERADAAARSAQTAAQAYTPADPAAWSGSPPATVQEALDRIAAALGPIT